MDIIYGFVYECHTDLHLANIFHQISSDIVVQYASWISIIVSYGNLQL